MIKSLVLTLGVLLLSLSAIAQVEIAPCKQWTKLSNGDYGCTRIYSHKKVVKTANRYNYIKTIPCDQWIDTGEGYFGCASRAKKGQRLRLAQPGTRSLEIAPCKYWNDTGKGYFVCDNIEPYIKFVELQ